MRTFLVLMVLCNLGYFGWRYWETQLSTLDAAILNSAAPLAAEGAGSGSGGAEHTLVLLSELAADSAPTARQTGQSARPQGTAGAVSDTALAQAAAPRLAPDVAAPGASLPPANQLSQNAAGAELATSGAGVNPPSQAAIPAKPAVKDKQCLVIDELGLEQRDQLRGLVSEAKLTGQIKSYERPVSSTWWVHIPAFASEELAQRMLLELQGKGIDSYYMRSGELAGGISLGVFSREESAVTTQDALARRGYTTKVRQIYRMEPIFRVTMGQSLEALSAVPRIRLFLEANQGLKVSEIVCESVAQDTRFP